MRTAPASVKFARTCAQVADRFASLQRRELVEPREPARFVRRGAKHNIFYEPGARGEHELAANAELQEARMANREMSKSML